MFYAMCHYLTELPRWHALAFVLVAYIVYYFLQVVKRPILACADGTFRDFLLRNVPTLETKYWPTFWCVESRAQTVFACLVRGHIVPCVHYRREILTLKDGGEVALDWMEDQCADDAPCVIILPGLTGASQAEYIKCLVLAANNARLRVVVFNNRGLGGIALKTPRFYSATNCDDLSEVVQHVRRAIPHCKLGAAGISMGGLILGNYLSRRGQEAREHLTAAKIISVPWDVHKGALNIAKPFLNTLFDRHFASSLRRTVKDSEVIRNTDIDMDRLLTVKSVKEFDAVLTSKQYGYAHVDDYYTDATLHNKLHTISVPLLCLSAADDPFQPLDAIPVQAAEESTHVAIVITARGGHLGFLEGFWPYNKEQYMGRIFAEFFTKALFDKDGEFEIIAQQLREEYLAKYAQHPTTSTEPSILTSPNINVNSLLTTEKLAAM